MKELRRSVSEGLQRLIEARRRRAVRRRARRNQQLLDAARKRDQDGL